VTQKNVPKYLTPGEAEEMLIENPMRSKQSPARMKGERRWMRSDHNAKTYTITAGARITALVGWMHHLHMAQKQDVLATMYGGTVSS